MRSFKLKNRSDTGMRLIIMKGRKYSAIVMQSNHAATAKSRKPTDEKLSRLKNKNNKRVMVIMMNTMLNRSSTIFNIDENVCALPIE